MARFKGVWCPECGCELKRRHGKFGDFYGCSGYPHCRLTMNLRDAARHEEPGDDDMSPAEVFEIYGEEPH